MEFVEYSRAWTKRFVMFMPIVAAAVGFFWVWRTPGGLLRPRAVFHEIIDLGEQVEGKPTVAEFAIENRGLSSLHVTDFRTNCGCIGVESLRNADRPVSVTGIDIAANSQERFRLRWNSRGPVGDRQRTVVEFRTNDLRHPTGRIEILSHIRGGVFAVPAQVNLGTSVIGQEKQFVIEIRDRGQGYLKPIRIDTVNLPEAIRVELLDLPAPLPVDSSDLGFGKLTGRIQVRLTASVVGSVSGKVRVFADGCNDSITEFGIFGEVVAPVRLYPSVLVLPQSTGEGIKYSGNVLCRSSSEAPFTLIPPADVPGINCRIADGFTARMNQLIELEVSDPGVAAGEIVLPFRAELPDGRTLELPVRVLIRPPSAVS